MYLKSVEWILYICMIVCAYARMSFENICIQLRLWFCWLFIWEKIWKWCIAQFENGFVYERRTCKILCVRASSPNFFCLVKDLLCRIRQKGIMREYIFQEEEEEEKFWFLVFAVNVIFYTKTFYQLSMFVRVGKMCLLFLSDSFLRAIFRSWYDIACCYCAPLNFEIDILCVKRTWRMMSSELLPYQSNVSVNWIKTSCY